MDHDVDKPGHLLWVLKRIRSDDTWILLMEIPYISERMRGGGGKDLKRVHKGQAQNA